MTRHADPCPPSPPAGGKCCVCGCEPCTPRCGAPKPRACPLPPRCPDPGTADIAQPTPPPTFGRSPTTDGKAPDRPGRHSPQEGPWFRHRIKQTLQGGPSFGPRKDEYVPMLVARAFAGDNGTRPTSGVFWESPDIYVLPRQAADTAPLLPPSRGEMAVANEPNTVYAHLWNLGKAPAYRVRVEFFWCNPTLGISRAAAEPIGSTWVDIGNRFTRFGQWQEQQGPAGPYMSMGSHVIVKCPLSWVPEFVNNGHECLVVRVFEPFMDALAPDEFSAADDRHVAQRNIAVALSGSPAGIDLSLDLGYQPTASQAEVLVEAIEPGSMQWLQLFTNSRTPNLRAPAHPVTFGLTPAMTQGSRPLPLMSLPFEQRKALLRPRERFERGCDPLTIGFHASVAHLEPGEALALRIQQKSQTRVLGGYTVVLMGRPAA